MILNSKSDKNKQKQTILNWVDYIKKHLLKKILEKFKISVFLLFSNEHFVWSHQNLKFVVWIGEVSLISGIKHVQIYTV